MKTICALLAVLVLSGCSVISYLVDCPDCALTPEEGHFDSQDPMGLLVFALTVDTPNPSDGELVGKIDWLMENEQGIEYRQVSFPKEMKPGQKQLIVWQVPPGTYSLRAARLGQGHHCKISSVLIHSSATTVVKAGRITIAGEITVKDQKNLPSISHTLETAFARSALNHYPGIAAPADEMPLVDMRLNKSGF